MAAAVDIVIAPDEENIAHLLATLSDLKAEYDTLHRPPIRPDESLLRTSHGPQLFRTRYGHSTYSRKLEARRTQR